MDRAKAIASVIGELDEAQTQFPRFNSAHEGLAVLREEYLELEQEVFTKRTNNDIHLDKLEQEARQVAAMGLRFLCDVIPDRRGK